MPGPVSDSYAGPSDEREAFHAHLDACPQCRNHPFDLCRIGEGLMRETMGQYTIGVDFGTEGLKECEFCGRDHDARDCGNK